MEIIISKYAGFCGGVKRALILAEKALEEREKVYSFGPLVHNNSVVEYLEKKGMKNLENKPDKNSTIVSRSHGICKEIKKHWIDEGFEVIDTTCPDLIKMNKKLEEMRDKRYNIVIIGDSSHPEVIGLNSQVNYEALIVNSREEAEKITNLDKVFILSQTTNREEKFQQLSALIAANNQNVEILNTICRATRLRQEACAELAQEVDAIIVIGGKNSSNTQKLATVAKEFCQKVYPIETAVELPIDQLKNLKKIGITAGASTPDWLIEEVVNRMDNLTKDEFMEQVEDSMKQIHPREIIEGEVIYVTDNEVMVNINYKSDGIIELDELSEDSNAKPKDLFNPGDVIEVYVIKLDDGEGNVILSTRRVEKFKNWQKLVDLAEEDATVEAIVEKDVKGGLIVNVMGIQGFIPGSHVDVRFVRDLKSFVGQTVPAKIISIDDKKRRLVLSRKIVIETERQQKLDEAWDNIEVNDVVTGKIARLTDFGAFIDLGGVDGLLHVSDIAWRRLKHPSEELTVGDEIEVKILRANRETNRISLGRKQLLDKPFDVFVKNNEIGDIVKGTVVNLLDFGAFVRLKEGLEGLVHVSQISHDRVEKPSDELNIEQEVDVKILEIDEERQRIGLSIKETKPQEKKEPSEKQPERRIAQFEDQSERPQRQSRPRPSRPQRQPRRTAPIQKSDDFENTIGSLVDFDFGMLGLTEESDKEDTEK